MSRADDASKPVVLVCPSALPGQASTVAKLANLRYRVRQAPSRLKAEYVFNSSAGCLAAIVLDFAHGRGDLDSHVQRVSVMRGHFRTTSVVVALIDDGDASRRTFMRFHTLLASAAASHASPRHMIIPTDVNPVSGRAEVADLLARIHAAFIASAAASRGQ